MNQIRAALRKRLTLSAAFFVFLIQGSCNPLGNVSSVGGTGTSAGPTPVITSTVSSQTALSPIPISVVFSASVIGFSASKVSISNGTASAFSGSGTTYAFDITPTAQGTVTVTLPTGAATDSSENPTSAATFSTLYATTSPTVTVNLSGSQSTPTGTLPISYSVAFNRAINALTFTSSDIVQNGSATGATWVITDSGDATNFTLTASAITGNAGSVIPSIAAGNVQDIAGNLSAASTSTNNTAYYLPYFADCYLWLKADSLSLSNGASVASWSDGSSFGSTVSQATSADQPTFLAPAQNSLPAVTFNGSTDVLMSSGNSGISGNPDMSVYVVARINAHPNNYPVFVEFGNTATNGAAAFFGLDTTSANLFAGYYNGGNHTTTTYPAGFALYEWIRDSGGGTNMTQAGNTIYFNGTSQGTTTSLSNLVVSIVNGPFLIGQSTVPATISADIAEMLVFSGIAMPAGARVQMEGYLNGKWNLW